MTDDSRVSRAIRWFFANPETGEIVIAQMPNVTLWIFIVAWIGGFLAPWRRVATGLQIVAAVALSVWAIDEIIRGSSPFRRVLGVAVLIYEAVRWFGG